MEKVPADLTRGRCAEFFPLEISPCSQLSLNYFPMLKEIEQLLRLQERDQKIKMFKAELETVPLEQQRIEQFVAAKSNAFDQVRATESRR